MRTTKTTEVIEEFDEQGRVVRRVTTTTEETENGPTPLNQGSLDFWYNQPAGAVNTAKSTGSCLKDYATQISGVGDPSVTLKG